jgi:hypothetical protein
VGDYPIRQIVLYEKAFLWLNASNTREGKPCLYTQAFALLLTKSTKNFSQLSIWTRFGDFAVFWGTASAGLLHVSSPRLTGGLQSAHGRHKCLPRSRTKVYPASANCESKLSVSALMWSAKDGIPKSSWVCLLPTYQCGLVAMRRHLDCKTCSF